MHVPSQLQAPARVDAPLPDTLPAQRRVCLWAAAGLGCGWGAFLAGLLLGLDRVPVPEALLWSVASAIVVGRSAQVGLGRTLRWLLAPCTLELGMSDPTSMRQRLPRALSRRGYRLDRRSLQRDIFAPRRAGHLLPRVSVAWSGPGAIVSGPRWLVRLAARIAVG